VLVLIVGLVVLAASIQILQAGVSQREKLNVGETKAIIHTANPTYVSPMSLADCSIVNGKDVCSYEIKLQGLSIASDEPTDVLISAEFRDRARLLRLLGGVDQNGVTVDLSTTFSSELITMPPAINASGMDDFKRIVYDTQRIIIGNYTVDVFVNKKFNILHPVETAGGIFYADADIIVTCKDGSDRRSLNTGDETTFSMCGGWLNAAVTQYSYPSVCLSLLTALGRPADKQGERVRLLFWRADSDFAQASCGGYNATAEYQLQGPLAAGMDFSVQDALADSVCASKLIGRLDVEIPVTAWMPSSDQWQPVAC